MYLADISIASVNSTDDMLAVTGRDDKLLIFTLQRNGYTKLA